MMRGLEFFEDGHRYELDGSEVPSVSRVIRFLSREAYSEVNEAVLQNAADRGTAIHKATEALDKYGECEIEDAYAGYIQAYALFLREHTVEWKHIEKPLPHREQGYAGTLDRVGTVDGKRCVLDIKSSAVIHKTLVKAQLNGYNGLCKANGLPDNETLYCLQLLPTGRYRLYETAIGDTEFNSCLALHKALARKHGRLQIA